VHTLAGVYRLTFGRILLPIAKSIEVYPFAFKVANKEESLQILVEFLQNNVKYFIFFHFMNN